MVFQKQKIFAALMFGLAILIALSASTYLIIDYRFPTDRRWIQNNLNDTRITNRFKVELAKQAGYSEFEIADHLSSDWSEQRQRYMKLLFVCFASLSAAMTLVAIGILLRSAHAEKKCLVNETLVTTTADPLILNAELPEKSIDRIEKFTEGIDSKKIIKTLLLVIAAFIVFGSAKLIGKIGANSTINRKDGNSTSDNSKLNLSDIDIENIILDTFKDYNKQLPKMIDKETRLDSTICNGKQLIYMVTLVDISAKDIDITKFKEYAKTKISRSQCSNKDMVNLLNIGVNYVYSYHDKDGYHIDSIPFSKIDCGL